MTKYQETMKPEEVLYVQNKVSLSVAEDAVSLDNIGIMLKVYLTA